jgi:hypothetical protein
MAFNLQAYTRFAALIAGEEVKIGSVEPPISLSVTGLIYKFEVSIAASGNDVIYNDELSGFSVLGVQSDRTIRLALEDTAVTPNTFSITCKGTGTANEYGPVTFFWDDDTVDASTRIDKITAYNDYDSTNAAKVRILVIQ